MSKVADVGVVEREDAACLPEVSDELRVALTDIAATAREGLLAMSVAVGLQVMAELMDEEITATVGPKHARLADRTAVRHASTTGSVVLGGRRVAVRRPRARTLDGREVQLSSYAAFAADDQLERVVFERMLAGLATRRHRAAAEPVGQAVEQARGLDVTGGLLVVIDGAKALASAVHRVFGDHALVQRCTLHKRRNLTDHLPKNQRAFVDRRLAKAFNDADPERGLGAARALARQLGDEHPDAAASLREGLEQMFTVRRLGVSDRLARTLSTTNAIESMISIARDTTRNVKNWRDGKMIKRWCAAGMLNAERSFRRLKGHNDMPVLVAALRRHAQQINENNTPVCDTAKVA